MRKGTGDKGKGEWHSQAVGTRRTLASSGAVAVKLEDTSLPATARPLRDMSRFQKLDFINQALRSYLTSFLAPSWPQSCSLFERNFKCYTKLRMNIHTWFQCSSPQGGGGLESSSEPGLGEGFGRREFVTATRPGTIGGGGFINPGLAQSSQQCPELLLLALLQAILKSLVTSQILEY